MNLVRKNIVLNQVSLFQRSMIDELQAVLQRVHPQITELNQRPLPGCTAAAGFEDFGTRYDTGVDCDVVFQDNLLIGNL